MLLLITKIFKMILIVIVFLYVYVHFCIIYCRYHSIHLGAFGTVNLFKNREDSRLYAAKMMLLTRVEEEGYALHELNLLKRFRHPFVVHLHDVFFLSQPRYTIMCSLGVGSG